MVYVVIIIYMIAIDIISDVLINMRIIEEIWIYVFYFPVFEESLKFLLAVRYGFRSFKYIIAFAAFEFIFVKLPIAFDPDLVQFGVYIALASIPFIFHVGSGYLYAISTNMRYIVMSVMLVNHASINYVVETTQSSLIAMTLLLSILPIILILAVRVLSLKFRLKI